MFLKKLSSFLPPETKKQHTLLGALIFFACPLMLILFMLVRAIQEESIDYFYMCFKFYSDSLTADFLWISLGFSIYLLISFFLWFHKPNIISTILLFFGGIFLSFGYTDWFNFILWQMIAFLFAFFLLAAMIAQWIWNNWKFYQ